MPESSAAALISLNEITKTYEAGDGTRVTAIRSLSLDILKGEFVAVVGRSGCGKTTLLKIVSGLRTPTSGSVVVEGQAVSAPLSSVGFVFQNPLLIPWRNALENILLPIELLHRDKREFAERAAQLIDVVGLRGFERMRPRELSGGMQQRVAIARALVHDPEILLMDEPFGSLDELTREEMAMELLKITERVRKTVIFVTHSVPEAVMLADRVVVLSPRPASLRLDLRIDCKRPRDRSTRLGGDYIRYCEAVRDSLMDGGEPGVREPGRRS